MEKVAIFLDVENLSGWLKADGGKALLERANKLGRVVVRRAYGDFSIPSVNARQQELNLLGFEYVHVCHPVKGKNSADIQIVVDVMEYLGRIPDLKWIILATGDSDFSPLFRRLRELGKSVIGVGPHSALSEAVKNTCDEFIRTDTNTKSANDSQKKSSDENKSNQNQSHREALDLLRSVIIKFPDGISPGSLKQELCRANSKFNEKNLGFNQFIKFLQSASEVVDLSKKNKDWCIKAKASKQKADKSSLSKPASELESKDVSTNLYRQLLKKNNWKSCDASFLHDVLSRLLNQFPNGFTIKEEREYLFNIFEDGRSRKQIQTAIYALYKTGYVGKGFVNNLGQPILVAHQPEPEEKMSRKIDIAIVESLFKVCTSKDIPFEIEFISPLLRTFYSKSQLESLVKEAIKANNATAQQKAA